jgi:molecular chaperone DnaK
VDKGTGREQAITISGASGLSKDEVERMVRDAEAHATDDQSRREAIEARNQADALIYQVEKTYNDNKAKLAPEEATRVESALAAATAAVKGDDVAAIRSATDALQQASHAMAEALYRASGSQGSRTSGDSGRAAGDGDVKEGEVVDAA